MSSEGHGERRVGGGGNRQGQKQPKKPTVLRLAAGKQMPKQIRQKQEVQETRSVPALEVLHMMRQSEAGRSAEGTGWDAVVPKLA